MRALGRIIRYAGYVEFFFGVLLLTLWGYGLLAGELLASLGTGGLALVVISFFFGYLGNWLEAGMPREAKVCRTGKKKGRGGRGRRSRR